MNIGNFFKEKFLSFSQSPSNDLWGKISSSDEIVKFNRRKRNLRIAKFSAAFFTVAILVVTLVVFLPKDENISDLPDDYTTKNIDIPEKRDTSFAFATNNNQQNNFIVNKDIKSDIQATPSALSPVPEHNKHEKESIISDYNTNIPIVTPNVSHETYNVPKHRNDTELPAPAINESSNNTNAKTNDTLFTPLYFSRDTTVCQDSKLMLFVLNAKKVMWNIGLNDPVIEIYPDKSTTYYAKVTKFDGQDTIINIKVDVSQCGLYIPNAFTPNGDGINDEFIIKIPEELQISNFEMSIFEASGRMIFHSKNHTQGWDGYYQGGKSPQGAYFYVITYKDKMNEKRIRKGQLILYR